MVQFSVMLLLVNAVRLKSGFIALWVLRMSAAVLRFVT